MLFPIADCQLPIFFAPCLIKSAISNWKSAMTSFVTQRLQRIDLRRAARWDPAGKQSNANQQNSDRRKRKRIAGADTKQQTLQQSRQRQRTEQAQRNAGDCESQSL